ncbi:MAG TPA: hypothetical protein VGX16_02870 [Solirubrobacteraceae bacterium]|jgi:hypothetical protein|nr:hypothetical protein [Solirubrobacteraceae bacterium]
MHSHSDNIRHQVKLPNGKQIEVVYSDEETGRIGELPLHVCPSCAGHLVYPLDWSEEGEEHWRILLRCPECQEVREGVFGQTAVELLDDELDRATGALLSDFQRMTHANMVQEIEFFVRALHADVIVPSDF